MSPTCSASSPAVCFLSPGVSPGDSVKPPTLLYLLDVHCSFSYPAICLQNAKYLLVLAQDPVLLAKENINGSSVVVFQRRSHHQVVEAVAVQVGDGSQSGAETGVLAAVVDLERAFKDKTVLRHRREIQSSLGQTVNKESLSVK